jgi:SnoaL-like polyketide cyclase
LAQPQAIFYESGVALPGAGPAAVKEFIGAICAAIPDNRITIDDMIAAEDKVVLRWSSLGTGPPRRRFVAWEKGRFAAWNTKN